jgi:hypothetical protein
MNGKRKKGTREERVVTNVGEIMKEMLQLMTQIVTYLVYFHI